MESSTVNWRKSSTEYFSADMDDQWADLNHPLFYYDPGFKTFCFQKLAELGKLQAGWDADRAPAIDARILDAVRQFVASLPQHIATRPMVVPLTSGGVQLEWHRGRQVLELEFESPDTVHYLKWDPPTGVEEEELIPVSDRDTLANLIRWFMKGMLDG
jgi:hypothetical protein